jgi:hypothetical protein
MIPHPSLLTLDNVNDDTVKIKALKLAELKDLCCHFHDVIKDLEVKLEEAKMKIKEAKVPVVTSDKAYELMAELKELKDLVLVDGINGMGDKPTGPLSQTNWATSDRRSIPWSVINKVVEDDALLNAAAAAGTKTSSKAKDDKTSSKARSSLSQGNRAKLIEKAKTTDMWCLLRFIPTTQEAMTKQRKICPINLRGGGGLHGGQLRE